jgi:hypothetical protein
LGEEKKVKVKGRKKKKKAWGEHQRIYIRRSIRTDGLLAIKIRTLQRLLILQLFTLSQCSRGLNPSAGKSSHLKLRACTGLYL